MVGTIVGTGISLCVDALMKTAVKAITPSTAGKLTKWAAMAGAMAVSGVIGKYIGDGVDEKIRDVKQKAKEKQEQIAAEQQLTIVEGDA